MFCPHLYAVLQQVLRTKEPYHIIFIIHTGCVYESEIYTV